MNTCPDVVLNTFLSAWNSHRVSSGNLEDRWSSIATIMARMTRSGTFVGPGTNRKLRPGILGSDILSSLKALPLRSRLSGLTGSTFHARCAMGRPGGFATDSVSIDRRYSTKHDRGIVVG